MPTQRRTAAAISSLALIALPLIAGGCGCILETNEAACRRIMNHFESCVPEGTATDEGGSIGGIDLFQSQFCEAVSKTTDDLCAIADCITSLSCAQLSSDEQPDFATQVQCLAALQSR